MRGCEPCSNCFVLSPATMIRRNLESIPGHAPSSATSLKSFLDDFIVKDIRALQSFHTALEHEKNSGHRSLLTALPMGDCSKNPGLRSDMQLVILVVLQEDGKDEETEDTGTNGQPDSPPQVICPPLLVKEALRIPESNKQVELPNRNRGHGENSDNGSQDVGSTLSYVTHSFSPVALWRLNW